MQHATDPKEGVTNLRQNRVRAARPVSYLALLLSELITSFEVDLLLAREGHWRIVIQQVGDIEGEPITDNEPANLRSIGLDGGPRGRVLLTESLESFNKREVTRETQS